MITEVMNDDYDDDDDDDDDNDNDDGFEMIYIVKSEKTMILMTETKISMEKIN